MSEVIDWTDSGSHHAIDRVRAVLASGSLAVLPSETGYQCAASGLHASAIAELKKLVTSTGTLTVVLNDRIEAADWLPYFRGAAARLSRRFWPGPLTLIGSAGLRWGLGSYVPQTALAGPGPNPEVALRVPRHPIWQGVLRGMNQPVLAVDCPETDIVEWASNVGKSVGVVVRDNSTQETQQPTFVRTNGREWKVVREGAILQTAIDDAAICRIVFVCTGNTCRSPMAEALCKRVLAERIGCSTADLRKHGFLVESAGLAAQSGLGAAEEALHVARARGADLSEHRSQMLTIEVLDSADFVIAMTYSQARALHGLRPDGKARLLSSWNEDIDDPIGGTPEIYQTCAEQIETELLELMPELLEG